MGGREEEKHSDNWDLPVPLWPCVCPSGPTSTPGHRPEGVPPLTQEVSRDGTLQVDVFGAIAVVQLPPDEGVQVEVERLQLVVEMLQVVLEGG